MDLSPDRAAELVGAMLELAASGQTDAAKEVAKLARDPAAADAVAGSDLGG